MIRILLRWLFVVLALGLAVPAIAQDKPLRGVALVIGESRYSNGFAPLANPRNDARAIDDLLGNLGFDVTRVLDGDGRKLTSAIDDFIDDARDADVALVYYSGHGIEAGGENYLVPTDADLSTPQAAGKTLLPVDDLLDRLSQAVPVTILLLDACRTGAFPPGTMIQPPDAPAPIPAAENGLAVVRGPAPVATATADASSDSLGTVIGFAAAPGHPALDGDPDGNSPYAAALLKHLGAGGYSFGDLMTMVSEEVYLKTKAQQLPWTNSSLRRVLSFGAAVEDGDTDEHAIREGRRQLLLTIAQEPQSARGTVEAIATSEGVPLDALYGMLKVLGVDTSNGAADLQKQLEEGARQLKQFKEQELGDAGSDPELVRLADLAGRAQDEGAIDLALKYREQATARARVLSSERDRLEAGLKSDRIEIGKTFADHGRTAALNFDYRTAAQMFGEAYAQVARWDDDLALQYKQNQAEALRDYGDYKADNEALRASIAAFKEALLMAPPDTHPVDWQVISTNLGWALETLGERSSDDAALKESVAVLQESIDKRTAQTTASDLAVNRLNLGNAVSTLGQRESDPKRMQQAIAIYQQALADLPREKDPYLWGKLQFNMASTLRVIGERTGSDATLGQSMSAFEAAIDAIRRDLYPLEWAQAQNNYATALFALGDRRHDVGVLQKAAEALGRALEEDTEERVPLDWAMAQSNLGNVNVRLSDETGDVETLRRGIAAYRAALTYITPQTAPLYYATAQSNLGAALESLSEKTDDQGLLNEAVAAFEASLKVRTEANDPPNWAMTQFNLSGTLARLGAQEVSPQHLQQAADAARAALRQWTRADETLFWGKAQYALGVALEGLGDRGLAADDYDNAAAAFGEALGVFDKQSYPNEWLLTIKRYAFLMEKLGERDTSAAAIRKAADAYREAAEATRLADDPGEFGRLNFNLGIALLNLDAFGAEDDGFVQAADAFRAALRGYTRERAPGDWADAQYRLGFVLHSAANKLKQGGIDQIKDALTAYRAAQEVRTVEADPLGWAEIETYAATAEGLLGVRSGNKSVLQQGRDDLQAAWDIYKARDSRTDDDFKTRLKAFDEVLASME